MHVPGILGRPGEDAHGDLTGEERRCKLTRLTVDCASASWLFMLLLIIADENGSFRKLAPLLAATLVTLALAKLLTYAGKDRAAAWVIVAPMLPLLSYTMWTCGGIFKGGGAFTIASVLFAAATLGRRVSRLIALGSAVSLAVIAWADAQGQLPPAWVPDSPLVIGGQLFAALVVSAILLDALVSSLHKAQIEADTASQQRAEVESRYVSAQKLEPVGQLASGVAHDFNNLLSVMTSVSAALRAQSEERGASDIYGKPASQSDDSGESISELLDDLDEATARASLMTGQLLSFSRRRVFEVNSIDLDEVLESLAPMLSRLLGDHIAVTFHGSTGGLYVEADRGQLEQVILNLAVNARDAMPKGGNLSITVGRDIEADLGIFLEVMDDGAGMSSATAGQIFTPFFTTKPTGTGLGLATVHDIISRLCGTIQVQSELNRGTTFRLKLPANESPSNSTRPSISRHRIVPKVARLLLAEDHELLRRATQRSLEQVGYSVTSVVNGQEALALLQGGVTFDALVTDISMPKLGGIELAEQLHAQGLGLPVVFISGNTGCLPSGLDKLSFPARFLAKPFSQSDFLAAIDKSVAQSHHCSIERLGQRGDGAA